jgi:AcrR family transcriptional regulator
MTVERAARTTTRSVSSGDRSADTRQRLIGAAFDLFVNIGYHGIRVSDITDYAGLGKGTFYLYFESKRDLLLACFQSVIETVEARNAAYVAANLDYFTRMGCRMSGAVDPEGGWRNIDTFLRVSVDSTDEEVSAGARRVHALILERGREELEEAMRAGMVRDVDPALAGQTVAGMTEVLAWRLKRDDSYRVATMLAFVEDMHRRLLLRDSPETDSCSKAAEILRGVDRVEGVVRAALPPRWPFQHGGDTRGKIIRAAVDLFLDVGYHNLRVSDLTDYAGVGKGTLYHHFAGKRDLLLAYFRLVSERVRVAQLLITEARLDHFERVAFRLRMWVEPGTKWNRIVTFVRIQADSPDHEIATAAWEAYRCIFEPAKADLEEAMRVGMARELDPELAALSLVGMQEVLSWWMDQDDTCDQATVLAFMADAYCRAFLR